MLQLYNVNLTFQVPDDFDYYSAIHKAIPNLKYLDDELLLIEKVDGQDVLCQRPRQYKTNKVPDHLITDSQLICESIKESVQIGRASCRERV